MAYQTKRTALSLAALADRPLGTIGKRLQELADSVPRGETYNVDAQVIARAQEAAKGLLDALMPIEWTALRVKPKA